MKAAVMLSLVFVTVHSQIDSDSVSGNFVLEWRHFPARVPFDSSYGTFSPNCNFTAPPSARKYFGSQAFWITDNRIGVLHKLERGFAIETFDSLAREQVAHLSRTFSLGEFGRDVWSIGDARRLREGGVGLWGVTYYMPVQILVNIQAPYPSYFSTTVDLETHSGGMKQDSSLRRTTRPRPLTFEDNEDFVLSYNASSFDDQVCYILEDVSRSRWRLVLYTSDLQWKIFQKEFPVPFPAVIRDSLGRDSIYYLSAVPYAIKNSKMGIAGRSFTQSGERVIVFFRGENFDDVRAIKLPSAEKDVGYFVDDGFVVDASLQAGRFIVAQVWENCTVGWTTQSPVKTIFTGFRQIPDREIKFELQPSRWGGFYVVGNGCTVNPPYSMTFLVRYNSFGRINGFYRAASALNCGIGSILEHYRDSSVYAFGVLHDSQFVVARFRFEPSDTSSIGGGNTPSDTTLGIWDRAAYGGVEVYPQPVHRGEQLRVVAMADVEAVEVWTLDGRRVVGMAVERSGEVAGVSMDVPAGVYVVQVRSSGGRQQRGLVMVMP